jgi:putative nucleotidyltransferase with HDIG domain
MAEVLEMESTRDIDEFRSRLEEMDALPSLPSVVVELLNLLREENSIDSEIVALISQDAGLTARLLKLANSAAMGLRVQVTSIQRAVPLLGRARVRQICLGGGVWDSLKPSAEKAGFGLDAFERHCLAVAELAQELAMRSNVANVEDVFASALLHDIGKFLLLEFDGEAYAKTLAQAAETNANLEELEFTTLGWTHARVGGWLADHWRLPNSIRDTVKLHHQPEMALRGENGNLVGLVSVANNLAKVVKLGNSGNPHIESIGPLLKSLNLSPEDVKEAGAKVTGNA